MRTANAEVRHIYARYSAWLAAQAEGALVRKSAEAELLFRRLGITFSVYGEAAGAERVIPFDVIPRIFGAQEWAHLERGLIQRVRALNAFLHDIYFDQEIIKAGIIPAQQILGNSLYRPEMRGIRVDRVSVHFSIASADPVCTDTPG